jgi:hypothetical protein
LHEFDGDGMFAATKDIGSKRASPCYILMQVKNGKYVRVHPTKVGTFDCNPKNVIERKLDLLKE